MKDEEQARLTAEVVARLLESAGILSRIEHHIARVMQLSGTADLDAELAKARYDVLSSRLDDVVAKLDRLLAGRKNE
jgi:hypothetical protein